MNTPSTLSRRERQILDILYAHGKAAAGEILESMSDPPSYSAVRAMLRVLEDKGHVRHEQDGLKYVYVPTVPRDKARRSAMRHLLNTFFDDSPEKVVAALLDSRPKPEELDRMAALIEKARQEDKKQEDNKKEGK